MSTNDKVNKKISIEHVTRVEGHGNIYVDIKEGKIKRCEWNVDEAPRFFEAMVVGQRAQLLHHITSRICGICSIGHTLASLKATEDAFDIKISPQDFKLRRLALHAETIQSHILHVGYLVLPDLMGVDSVIPLASTHPEEVKIVINLHKLGNEMSNLLCGRTTHPQRMVIGGFTKIPTMDQLINLKEMLKKSIPSLEAVAELIFKLAPKIPDFTRETEYIALSTADEYAFYDGILNSTDTDSVPVSDYLSFTNEFIVPISTAKRTKHARESYMVGALARLNLNYERLSPLAKKVAGMFGLKPMCYNPFMNSIAQLVETVHSVEESIRLIDAIDRIGLEPQSNYHVPDVPVRAGRGVGAVEVPRGILFHDYTYDEKGICKTANCVIPTNQNHGNIEDDMEAILPQIMDRPKKEIELTLEMLVRAYDTCISCSTHYINVKFV